MKPDTEADHIAACIRDRVCHCGEPLDVAPDIHAPYRQYVAMCLNCYDGADDSATRNHYGTGGTPEAAVRAWADSIDPWPDLLTCCACEATVTADRATARTHHGYGDPLCDGCVDGGQ